MGFISFNKMLLGAYYISGAGFRCEEDKALSSKRAWSSEGGSHTNIPVIIHCDNEN